MPSSGLGAYQVKIHQIVFGGLFFLIVLMGVRAMMSGGAGNLKLLAVLSIVVAAVLALDKYYWVLCPALIGSRLAVPGLPFSGAEVGCLLLVAVYFVRQAMRKEHAIRLNRHVFIAFPVFLWIAMVWMLNPTGMAMLGSSSIGARFYFQVVLGFVTLLVLSAFRLSERDCRVLFGVIVAASLFSFFQTQFSARVNAFEEGIALEERGSRYYLLGALTLYILMFSRYRLSVILSSLWKLGLVLLFALLTVYSGKRRGFGSLMVVPFLRSFFTGRDKLLVFMCSVVGALVVGVAVAGDGPLWELPLSARRSLSVIVPKYATSSAMGMTDLFREEVRLRGREVIRRTPWFGRKGYAMDREETIWMNTGGTTGVFEGHAVAGNWHSTWYAFACDFGLPAMILWALFLVCILRWIFLGFRRKTFGEFSLPVYSYYAFVIFLDAIFSYTSGHSGLTSFATWINWGMALAILNGRADRVPSVQREVTA